MSGHTPGPWTVRAGSFPDDALQENVVAYEIVMPAGAVISKANAELIEAAPDLLEAAHSALAQLTGGFPGDPLGLEWFPATDTVHALASAIAKAEGR